jgi:serine protease Do
MEDKGIVRNRAILFSLAVFCLLVGMAIGLILRGTDRSAAASDAQLRPEHRQALVDLQDAFSAIADDVSDAVVYVKANSTVAIQRPRMVVPPGFEDLFRGFRFNLPDDQGGSQTVETSGTGMIVRSDGYILTNDHIVGDADKVTVVLKDGREFGGKVSSDYRADVAVIKIDAKDLPTVRFADSDKVRVGEWAIAIGNPLGLTHSVTVGVVSAKYRQEQVQAGNQERFYPELIQTDASINRGNSGGPLLDVEGDVIGMNTLILSPTGGSIGVGFAIPSNQIKYAVDQLIETGEVKHGYIGVGPSDLTPERAKRFGVESGALIEEVSAGTPAAKAGLQPGDVVTEIDGKKVENALDLRNIIGRTEPGTTVKITIVRDKKEQTVKAKLVEAPDLSKGETRVGARTRSDNLLGVEVAELTPDQARQLNLPTDAKGVVVTWVNPSGPAAQRGVEQGQVIYQINETKVSSVDDFEKATKSLKPGDFVVLRLRTSDRDIMLDLRLEK